MNKIFYTIIFMALSTLGLSQVGVNTNDPDQALDVNGKVKLADDATTPTAGTMRYESTAGEFQGYNGASWQSFGGGRVLPSDGAIPIYASGTVSSGSNIALTIRDYNGNFYTTPPAGKLFIVMDYHINPSNVSTTGNYYTSIQSISNINFNGPNTRTHRFSAQTQVHESSGLAPIFVVGAGRILKASNLSTSSGPVSFHAAGFLVDDIVY